MLSYFRLVVTCLATSAMLAAVGCGSKEPAQPASEEVNATAKNAENSPAAGPTTTQTAGPTSDPMRPVVLIETSLGDITVRLDAQKAGLTVDNFLTYVEDGHYDQTVFHQVVEDYVVLGGTFTKDMVKKSAHTSVRNEAHTSLKNRRGTISMAREPDVTDSATCQFFFNVIDNPALDYKEQTPGEQPPPEAYGYCAFGEVIAGMDVVDRISKVEVRDTDKFESIPVRTVMINSMRRTR